MRTAKTGFFLCLGRILLIHEHSQETREMRNYRVSLYQILNVLNGVVCQNLHRFSSLRSSMVNSEKNSLLKNYLVPFFLLSFFSKIDCFWKGKKNSFLSKVFFIHYSVRPVFLILMPSFEKGSLSYNGVQFGSFAKVSLWFSKLNKLWKLAVPGSRGDGRARAREEVHWWISNMWEVVVLSLSTSHDFYYISEAFLTILSDSSFLDKNLFVKRSV